MISRPKSKALVKTKCAKCFAVRLIVFAELIRTTNTQSKYVELYHCPSCYRTLPERVEAARQISLAALPRIIAGASERSRALWEDPDYREKCQANADVLSRSPEFAAKVSRAIKKKFSTESNYVAKVNTARYNRAAEFLSRCDDVHDSLYDYSQTVYLGVDVLFKVICSHHGPFFQLPSNHVRGHGCPTCAVEKSKISQSEFLGRCSYIHNYKYDYSETVYESSLQYITYKCSIHGNITQLAQNHIKGRGCRFCDALKTTSIGEDSLATYVSTLVSNRRNDRIILDGSEIDIVVDSKRMGIEYHGLYWHSFNRIESKDERYYHYDKLESALARGYSLIQIYENEWLTKTDIVKSMLAAKLGVETTSVYARKCVVSEIDESQASRFFDSNHLQGHRRSMRYLGLLDGELIALASFNTTDEHCELIRFCNRLGTRVVGGLSKLIKWSKYDNVFTYADRRYSVAKAYLSSGFKLLGVTSPGYKYCKGIKTYSRQLFQKHKLSNLLPYFDSSLSEAQNMFSNGYRRIWDAGHYKLMWSK